MFQDIPIGLVWFGLVFTPIGPYLDPTLNMKLVIDIAFLHNLFSFHMTKRCIVWYAMTQTIQHQKSRNSADVNCEAAVQVQWYWILLIFGLWPVWSCKKITFSKNSSAPNILKRKIDITFFHGVLNIARWVGPLFRIWS